MSIYWTAISTTLGKTHGSLTSVCWETRSPCRRLISLTGPPFSRFRSFGTRVPDCSLAGELVAAFFAGRGLMVSSSELSALKVLLLLIISISISFSSLIMSFEAADCEADSVFGIVVLFFCSGVVCGGGGVSSEEGASWGTGFSEVISSNVSNRVRQ